ncbi:Fatty acid synthase subunit alpha, partial [Phytophthora palmivora]
MSEVTESHTTTTTTTTGENTETIVTTTTTTTTTTEETTSVSALADAMDKYTLIPEFGGQGISYWTELQRLYAASETNATRAFIDTAAQALLEESSTEEAKASVAFEAIIDVHSWLKSLEIGDAPAELALDRVYFSMPLLVLTQCANYLNFLDTAGVTHESVVKNSTTAVGHSQGVVSAVIFS